MKTTGAIIEQAFSQYRPALAYSGGADSTCLLDIVCNMGHRPPLIYTDSQMEYSNNLPFVMDVANRYGLTLHTPKAAITPQECWEKHGYPMLGKMSAAIWMQKHRGSKSLGFRIDVSTCCRVIKMKPARDLLISIGCNATLTGQRGAQDDRLRALRAVKDGPICYVKKDKTTVINPLLGWTDLMISRYTENHRLPVNPNKQKGALTIGCMYCGGGAQFDNSGFRVLRNVAYSAWRRMIVEFGFGPIILAIKYNKPLDQVNAALGMLGGLPQVADTMPHVFDFLRHNPLKGYDR